MPVSQIANVDLIKQVNSATVYRLIDQQGPISRVRIAQLSQLAPASITKITRQLLEHGLIKEVALQASTGGRRAVSLTTVQESFQLLSVKLTRGKMQVSLYDLTGNEQAYHEADMPGIEQQQVIQTLTDELEVFMAEHCHPSQRLIGIAVTIPGIIDSNNGTIVYTPLYSCRQLPLAKILREHFGCQVFVGNDILAMALAEHLLGASQDSLDSILVSIHRGIGSGILTNGKVFRTQNNSVGEIGHIQVDPLGKRCACGNFGCLETIVSNGAILSRVRDQLQDGRHSSMLSAKDLSIEGVCEAAIQGDPLARSVLDHVGEHLGRAIAIMVNLFNPQKLLLTGEIVAASEILFPAIQRCIEHQSLPSFHQDLPIVAARFQNQPTIGGFAIIKRALVEERLLQDLMGN
ncbi:ROK family transcriptional regulator [Dongshaea marina]|uniref:ROK family transcriptional regulator n=1 Tax=Dongshaea marina TaxID=2047966 RepID=UPI000D3E5C45|nr:ROK family transcriptional regulator [Dongshaea marina]